MGSSRVIVVGAGVGGLSTACLLADAGREVVVLEQAAAPGGRARSVVEAGFVLNHGPHALYRGVARATLLRLGLALPGGRAPVEGSLRLGEVLHALPGGPWTFATTGALGSRGRLALGSRLLALAAGVRPPASQSVAEWCADLPDDAAGVLLALVRVATYTHAPERQRADLAAAQIAASLAGVDYLDGGWQSIVDGLHVAAEARGVQVHAGVQVQAREADGVRSADGRRWEGEDVVLAVPPAACRRLGVAVPERAAVRAACLDLGLATETLLGPGFLLGVDRPVYLSVHTRAARLARAGQVLHVARYLAPGEDGKDALGELEQLLDQTWSGWRAAERVRRWAPSLPVAWDLRGVGEAPVAAQADAHTWLVGDWVGDEGLLLDASVASAVRVEQALGHRRARAVA